MAAGALGLVKRLWLLNFDAEREMVTTASGGVYKSPARLIRTMENQAGEAVRLTQGEEWAFWHARPRPIPMRRLLIWCGTRSILHGLSTAQLRGPAWAGPSASTTTAANDKATWNGLTCRPPRRHVLSSIAELRRWLSDEVSGSPGATALPHEKGGRAVARLKPRWSWAGRGQRSVSATLSADDERFAEALLRTGAVVEPVLAPATLFAIHGVLRSDGERVIGTPRSLPVDARGAPRGKSIALMLDAQQLSAVGRVLDEVIEHLQRLDWFGPFGLDLAWFDSRLCLIDLNARFTLGWSEGLERHREEALQCVTDDQFGHAFSRSQ